MLHNKMSPNPKSPKGGHNPNAYLKYSGMVMQLFVLLFLAAYAGIKLDAWMGNEVQYFTAALVLFAVIVYLIKIYFDLSKNP